MSLEVMLSEEQSKEIKADIYQLIREAVDDVSTNVESKTWLRRSDIENYLPMSLNTFDKKFGGLPYHDVYGTKLYNRKQIDEFIMKH